MIWRSLVVAQLALSFILILSGSAQAVEKWAVSYEAMVKECKAGLNPDCYGMIMSRNVDEATLKHIKTWPKRKLYALALINGDLQGFNRHYLFDDSAIREDKAAELEIAIGKIIGPPPTDPAGNNSLLKHGENGAKDIKPIEWDCPARETVKVTRGDRSESKGSNAVSCPDDDFFTQWPTKNKAAYFNRLIKCLNQNEDPKSLQMLRSLPPGVLEELNLYYQCGLLEYVSTMHQTVHIFGLISEALGMRKASRRQTVGHFGEYVEGGTGSRRFIFYPNGGLPPLLIEENDETLWLMPRNSVIKEDSKAKVRIHYSYAGTLLNGYARYYISLVAPERNARGILKGGS